MLFAEVYVYGMDWKEITVDSNGIMQPNVTENKNIPITKEEDYYRWKPDLSTMPSVFPTAGINGILMELERRDREKAQKK